MAGSASAPGRPTNKLPPWSCKERPDRWSPCAFFGHHPMSELSKVEQYFQKNLGPGSHAAGSATASWRYAAITADSLGSAFRHAKPHVENLRTRRPGWRAAPPPCQGPLASRHRQLSTHPGPEAAKAASASRRFVSVGSSAVSLKMAAGRATKIAGHGGADAGVDDPGVGRS